MDRSFREVLRLLRPLAGAQVPDVPSRALEQDPPIEAALVAEAASLELAAIREIDPAESAVIGFTDGIQRSRIVAHVDAVPIIDGVVAAVVRERVDRRMRTWEAADVQRALYLPRRYVPASLWDQLEATAVPLVDISGPEDQVDLLHPLTARSSAIAAVSLARERLERNVVVRWSRSRDEWLWVDGGLSGYANLLPEQGRVFGVVKSHNTLYGSAELIRNALVMKEGQRSPAFLVEHRVRRSVISWYLRLHHRVGDPLHGLVRVEILPTMVDAGDVAALGAMAAQISAWILAERTPLSLPDRRWHTLSYGVYDCERYLTSLIGE